MNVTLARNPGGGLKERDVIHDGMGTVLATVVNNETGEQRTGFVTDRWVTISSDQALCRAAVEGWSHWYGDSYTANKAGAVEESLRLSDGYVLEHKLDFVISSITCKKYFIEYCEFTVGTAYNGDTDNALWMNCDKR